MNLDDIPLEKLQAHVAKREAELHSIAVRNRYAVSARLLELANDYSNVHDHLYAVNPPIYVRKVMDGDPDYYVELRVVYAPKKGK